jgi:hypothetical protein
MIVNPFSSVCNENGSRCEAITPSSQNANLGSPCHAKHNDVGSDVAGRSDVVVQAEGSQSDSTQGRVEECGSTVQPLGPDQSDGGSQSSSEGRARSSSGSLWGLVSGAVRSLGEHWVSYMAEESAIARSPSGTSVVGHADSAH